MESRKHGYYWVTLNNTIFVALYSEEIKQWFLPGIEEMFIDSEFDHINEKRIEDATERTDNP